MSRWMSSKLQRNVQRTVQQHCANCHSGNQCFLTQQPTCFYSRQLNAGEQVQRCRYFEESVLANEPDVQHQYETALKRYLGETPPNSGTCKKCRKPFEKSCNRNVYCDECKSAAAKESATRRKRTQRQKQRTKQG